MSHDSISRRNALRTSGAALASVAAGASIVGTVAAGLPPSIRTEYSTVSGNEVTTHALLESLGDDDSADVWFNWGPEGDGLPYDTRLYTMYSPDGFCDGYKAEYDDCPYNSYGSLSPDTYEYQATASNDHGVSTGTIKTFTIY